MFPTIYHVFFEWFGVEWHGLKLLNSFGFFVALAFIFGSWTLGRELRRKQPFFEMEKRKTSIGVKVNWSEVLINGAIGFIFGWKIIWLFMNSKELFQPGSLPQEHIFSSQGLPLMGLILGAAFAGWKFWEYKKNELPEPEVKVVDFEKYQYTGTITLVAAISGITGAKFFHLFENPKEFIQFFSDPTLENFLSGLTIYGGLICGGIAVWLWARRKNIPSFHIMDAAAPGLILAYGIGRIGCHVSGDGDWGIANAADKPEWLSWLPDCLWSYEYPNNVNAVRGPFEGVFQGGYRGIEIPKVDPNCKDPFCDGLIDEQIVNIYEGYGTYLDPGVFPTPVYETTMAFLTFALLWYLRKRIRIPGMIFAIWMIFNGLERFFIEKIRVNNISEFWRKMGLEVTQAEVISTTFVFAGVAFAIFLWKFQDKLPKYPKLVGSWNQSS